MSDILKRALTQYGIKEIPGIKNNPEIMKYFDVMDMDWVQDDETAWCSAFMNWCCIESGKPASMALNARSWLGVGNVASTPQLGDIIIFWREDPKSWKGHVGIYINHGHGAVWTLGGNQNNMVCIKPYPSSRVIGYRRV